jgi:hypothetical protein
MPAASAVNAFVFDAMPNWVRVVTGAGSSVRLTPWPFAPIALPSSTIASARPPVTARTARQSQFRLLNHATIVTAVTMQITQKSG